MPPALASVLDLPADHPFPRQNLPYGVFRPTPHAAPRVGVAVGAGVLDLAVLEAAGFFAHPALEAARPFRAPTLNAFMALTPEAWDAARTTLLDLVRPGSPLDRAASLWKAAYHLRSDVTLCLPATVGDYTDFYASREHATNVGTLFRGPERALQPNWLHLPVGYHGRASSVVVSGTPIRRPRGQVLVDDAPAFRPSERLDYELEMGVFVGGGNALGAPVPVETAHRHVFGFVLLNDWSARDVQRWEYVPLGPFLGKNFATTISPWVVPAAALAPCRVPGPHQDPAPLPYLAAPEPRGLDVHLEVVLRPAGSTDEVVLSRSNARHLYWSPEQMIAHHTVGGCNLRPGDLLGTGTISAPEGVGSLLEQTENGRCPLSLPDGTTRTFLADGDEVILRGWGQGPGYRVGLGEARGRILPAP